MAEKGSIIFGFGSKKIKYDERLLYIAVVTKKPPKGKYSWINSMRSGRIASTS